MEDRELTTNQGFNSFIAKTDYSSPYIYYERKNLIPAIINNANGSAYKEISKSVLELIPITIAPKTIRDKYTKIVKPIFDRQILLEEEISRLNSLRDWLLPMLMDGQVKVSF